jgi:hypothetical protein
MLLQLGNEGPDVLNLERVINALGYSGFEIDGEFDVKTENVIKNIQKTNGLLADGKVGDKTFALLDSLYEPTKPNFSSSNFLSEIQVKTVHVELLKPSESLPAILKNVHPVLATRAMNLIAVAKRNGYTIQITQGLRTFDEQDRLYAQGRTTKGSIVTNAKGGQSYHNYGIAFDVAFIVNGKISWDEKLYYNLANWTKEVNLEWGGKWHFRDLPHCQLPNMTSIKKLRSIYDANGRGENGIKAVWEFAV